MVLVPGWQKKYRLLQKEIKKLIGIFNKVGPSEEQREAVVHAIFKCSNHGVFTPAYDANTNVLSYDFKRTYRLTQPRAGLLLQKYAGFLTREALDQELETPLPPAEEAASAPISETIQQSINGK